MQDGKNGAVAPRVEKVHTLPGPLEGRSLGLSIADDRDRDEVRAVEHGPKRVGQHVSELAPFVDRSGRMRAYVARHPSGGRELAKEAEHPGAVAGDLGVDVAVGPLEPDVGENGGATVPGPRKKQHIGIAGANDSIEVRVEKAQTG